VIHDSRRRGNLAFPGLRIETWGTHFRADIEDMAFLTLCFAKD
jgi:hypothetical protein